MSERRASFDEEGEKVKYSRASGGRGSYPSSSTKGSHEKERGGLLQKKKRGEKGGEDFISLMRGKKGLSPTFISRRRNWPEGRKGTGTLHRASAPRRGKEKRRKKGRINIEIIA